MIDLYAVMLREQARPAGTAARIDAGSEWVLAGVLARQGGASLRNQRRIKRAHPRSRGPLDAVDTPLPVAGVAASRLSRVGIDVARDAVA